MNSLFAGRIGVLATMHRKEEAIAPILKRELGVEVVVPANFDTDRFGTFTREKERSGSQLEAAKLKADAALHASGETLGFASEGTFGPHPIFPYIACNREIVVLLDKTHDLVLVGESFSTETNYRQQNVQSFAEALGFAFEVGFPEHGLVVMDNSSRNANNAIVKGITTEAQLAEAVAKLLINSSEVRIETDMRALYNPTRMKNIQKATLALIAIVNRTCPQCNWPGFEIVETKKGLPCSLCHLPTEITLAVVYACKKCHYSQEIQFPDGLEAADPAQCMYCNP